MADYTGETNKFGNATGLPFSSFSTGTGLLDLAFSAEDLRVLSTSFWGDGVIPVQDDLSDGAVRWVNGMNVLVRPGRAHVDGTVCVFDQVPLTLAAAGDLPRVDSIVIRRDLQQRRVDVGVVSGVPAANAAAPALTYNRGGVAEFRLADIVVAAKALQLAQADILDMRRFMQIRIGIEGNVDVFPRGWLTLLPWRNRQLPFGWYMCNGEYYPNTSAQAVALNGLSADFRRDWGIVNTGAATSVPNFFQTDGRGSFPRAVNGSARQVGSVEGDAIRNIQGQLFYDTQYGLIRGRSKASTTGAFTNSTQFYNNAGLSGVVGVADGTYNALFDASRVVPTAAENRPLNTGMTPAIYLGV